MLFRPLNPPILGDFENPVPPKIGGLGGRYAAFEVIGRCVYTVAKIGE